MTFEDFKKELLNTIKTSGELKPVFDKLMPALSDTSELLDEFIILNQSFNAVERQFNKQLVSLEDYNVNKNRIVNGLMAFIRDELTAKDLSLVFGTTTTAQDSPTPEKSGQTLSTLIQEMGFKKPLNKAALVNCNRHEANDIFCEFFSEKDDTPYQFYFILGNSEQLPERFGERLIYTIIDEFTDSSETAINFQRGDDYIGDVLVNRALIEELPAKFKCDLSKQAFKRYCDERFTLGDTTLEDFIAVKSKQLAFEYIAFVFEYDKRVWNAEMLGYFEWLIQSFRQNRADKPTFLFFFVIKTDSFTEPEKVHDDIEELVNRHAEAALMMPNLVSVSPNDVRTWLKIDAQAKDITKVEAVFAAYLASINRTNGADPIEMMYLENLQKSIFTASLTTH
jgi:inactive STAND/Effector-associated domain 11